MKLSTIAKLRSFALLGPGFSGGDGCLLLSSLRADRQAPRLVYAPYESAGRDARTYSGELTPLPQLELDVLPRTLAPLLDETGHGPAVARIRESIAAGDVYQVNLTLRATFQCDSGAAVFATLCRRGLPRFAAWVRLPEGTEFVSASPELFFEIVGNQVRSEPMKGTAPRTARAALEASRKDRAELAMITDLVRNDLTPLCVPRSVEVTNERRLLLLPYAVQAVSEVAGLLRDGVTMLDTLDALHPGGSITGAPKAAARDLITLLEPSKRGAYCGALGFVDGGRSTFSLLIRTAERSGSAWTYGVGGGIVWESDAARELDEARLKLGALS